MPRIKRWFPVSHDINADPEVWELRELYTDRAAFIWLEMLSIADRNDGVVGPDTDHTVAMLASRCRTSRAKVQSVLNHGCAKGWLRRNPHISVVNFAKYHRTKEQNKFPTDLTRPSEPSELRNAAPVALDVKIKSNGKLDPAIKEAADRIYLSDKRKFSRLVVWIKDKEKRDYPSDVVVAALDIFWAREKTSKVKDWWPYLEKIFTKLYGRWNEEQAEKHKDRDRQFINRLVETFSSKVAV